MDIDILKNNNHIPTKLFFVKDCRLIWRSSKIERGSSLSDQEFVAQYSKVVENGFFTDDQRISGDGELAIAERYGGAGVGINGGGARVVNFAGVQLKGVGANALAGRDALATHSYGGLDIQGAVKELIYSELINQISPVGAQKIEGIILLDRSSARYNGVNTWSAILVREECVRPAHFMSCTDFRVKPEYKMLIKSDVCRVRAIYHQINNECGLSNFYLLLENFLENAADQLSVDLRLKLTHLLR